MSINLNIKHNTTTITDITSGSVTLNTAGKICSDNISFTLSGAEFYDGGLVQYVNKPTNLTPSASYTGSVITNGYTTPTGVTMTGNNSGTAVGTYTAVYTPNSGYMWSDGTTSSVSVVLTINKATGYVTVAPTSTNATATTYQDVAICNAGSGTGTMYYSKDGSNYSTSIPTQNGGGGNITIYYYAEASTNYTRSAVGSVSCYLYPDYLCCTANTAGSTIAMDVEGTPTLGQNFTYSTDRINWTTLTPDSTTITLASAGDKVYFKGNNLNGVSESLYINYSFEMTGSIAVSGNIMSLIDNGACNTLTIPNNYCFYYLFGKCYSLTTAPALPATTLTEMCYGGLFQFDSLLTTPPKLPATTLANACYRGIFSNCKGLTTAPALPATTLAENCYASMFSNCQALTTAPALPATTLTEYCYDAMFDRCAALTTAPALPATTLASKCYAYMFKDCTSLTTASALPATTLADNCYESMFYNCTSLTTAPALPATTLAYRCCICMFYGCSSLIVSDQPVSGTAEQAWRIPSSGTFTNTYSQSSMFGSCAKGSGRSSSDMAGAQGASYTYYTQNTPV